MEKFKYLVSGEIENFKEEKINFQDYEVSFRRWLVSEIDGNRMSLQHAMERFKFPETFKATFRSWQKTYSEKFHLSLAAMTSEELANQEKLEARIKELEKQLKDARFSNIALNTLIDVAEKSFKIAIRKKLNTK